MVEWLCILASLLEWMKISSHFCIKAIRLGEEFVRALRSERKLWRSHSCKEPGNRWELWGKAGVWADVNLRNSGRVARGKVGKELGKTLFFKLRNLHLVLESTGGWGYLKKWSAWPDHMSKNTACIFLCGAIISMVKTSLEAIVTMLVKNEVKPK